MNIVIIILELKEEEKRKKKMKMKMMIVIIIIITPAHPETLHPFTHPTIRISRSPSWAYGTELNLDPDHIPTHIPLDLICNRRLLWANAFPYRCPSLPS